MCPGLKMTKLIKNRKPRGVRRIGIIFLEPDAVNIYQAYFYLNNKVARGISLDKKKWFKRELFSNKIDITSLLGERILTDREKFFISQAQFFVRN